MATHPPLIAAAAFVAMEPTAALVMCLTDTCLEPAASRDAGGEETSAAHCHQGDAEGFINFNALRIRGYGTGS